MNEFARSYPAASFVQVGANDGVQSDPLHRAVIERRWSGVMVEPLPHIFERLRANYEGVDRVRLENVAIADHDGTFRLYYVPDAGDDPTLPDWYDGLASFDKDVILQHATEIPDIGERLQAIDVPCVTFATLCRRNAIRTVDLISTDVEGYDSEILRDIDLEGLRPKVVLFEHYHMDRPTYDECVALVSRLGYESLAVGMDTIALQPDLIADAPSLQRLWKRLRARPELLAFRSEVA
jgi:FkbM family methyltransferase